MRLLFVSRLAAGGQRAVVLRGAGPGRRGGGTPGSRWEWAWKWVENGMGLLYDRCMGQVGAGGREPRRKKDWET